ncbi:MAG TPA: GAF domain-containing protein [Leptolyngbyaceae cyanobacterium]
MTERNLPEVLEKVFRDNTTPDAVFAALLPALGEVLKCDRVFLYLHHPETSFGQIPSETSFGQIPYCWRRSPEYPDMTEPEWKKDPESLPQEDPLFAAALRAEPSIFVEDIETASPTVLNKEYERKNFGHRALIHAHLRQDNSLWGILQPCVFGEPRVWTDRDRFVIDRVVEKITPMAVTYVKKFN